MDRTNWVGQLEFDQACQDVAVYNATKKYQEQIQKLEEENKALKEIIRKLTAIN